MKKKKKKKKKRERERERERDINTERDSVRNTERQREVSHASRDGVGSRYPTTAQLMGLLRVSPLGGSAPIGGSPPAQLAMAMAPPSGGSPAAIAAGNSTAETSGTAGVGQKNSEIT